MGRLGDQLLDFSTSNTQPVNQETCERENGSIYTCNVGHCCGEGGCCTYYYELWWFWLIWGLVIFMTCCCIYHHRQKRRDARRLRNNSHATGREPFAGACNYPGPPLDNKVLGYCKLPLYDDVIRIPPSASPPPPYTSRRRPVNTIACVQQNENGDTAMTIVPCNITSSMLSLASLSYYIPKVLAQNNLSPLTNFATNNRQNMQHTTSTTNKNVDTPSIIPCCTSTNTSDGQKQQAGLSREMPELTDEGCSYNVNKEVDLGSQLSEDGFSDDDIFLDDVDLNNNVTAAFIHSKLPDGGDQHDETTPLP